MPRLQIDMPDHRIKALEQLMEDCGLATKKDVVNNALTLFQWAVDEKKHGNAIASLDRQKDVYRELSDARIECGQGCYCGSAVTYKSAG